MTLPRLTGLLAIDPRAVVVELAKPPAPPANKMVGTVCIVSVRGPLEQHVGGLVDSYEAVLARAQEACESTARTVVLKINSPGGAALGCFEAARELRAKCAAAGKALVAYVDGMACSAAYALASAAGVVVVPKSGFVGSVGVLDVRADVTARDAALGERITLITSSARKGDGHPHTPMTEDELAETQARVDSLASEFFSLCSDMRGRSSQHYASLGARMFHGAAAVTAGLADRVQSFDQLLAQLASSAGGVGMSKYSEARAALQSIAEGDNEEEKKKALAALAAMDGGEDEPAAEGEPPAEEPEARAEGGPGEDEEEEDDAPPAAVAAPAARAARPATVPAGAAGQLAATVASLSRDVASLKRGNEASALRGLLASRPDLAPELVKVYETMPLAQVKAIIAATPKAKAPRPAAAAASSVQPTLGEGQGDGRAARLPAAERRELNLQMGLVPLSTGVVREPHKLTLGATVFADQAPAPAAPAAGKVA